jgi:hypothetical protein
MARGDAHRQSMAIAKAAYEEIRKKRKLGGVVRR